MSYIDDIECLLMHGRSKSRADLLASLEQHRNCVTESIFYEVLGGALASGDVREDDAGLLHLVRSSNCPESNSASATETPPKRSTGAFDFNYLYTHVKATKAKGGKVKCIVCNKPTSYKCEECCVPVCGVKERYCTFEYHVHGKGSQARSKTARMGPKKRKIELQSGRQLQLDSRAVAVSSS
jgi:hypothetical protein